jgi:hypothetical protein
MTGKELKERISRIPDDVEIVDMLNHVPCLECSMEVGFPWVLTEYKVTKNGYISERGSRTAWYLDLRSDYPVADDYTERCAVRRVVL